MGWLSIKGSLTQKLLAYRLQKCSRSTPWSFTSILGSTQEKFKPLDARFCAQKCRGLSTCSMYRAAHSRMPFTCEVNADSPRTPPHGYRGVQRPSVLEVTISVANINCRIYACFPLCLTCACGFTCFRVATKVIPSLTLKEAASTGCTASGYSYGRLLLLYSLLSVHCSSCFAGYIMWQIRNVQTNPIYQYEYEYEYEYIQGKFAPYHMTVRYRTGTGTVL